MTLLSDTEARLRQNLAAGAPLFSGMEAGDIPTSFSVDGGATWPVVDNAQITAAPDHLEIVARTSVPGLGELDLKATCAEQDGRLGIDLVATLPAAAELTIPGLASVGVDNLACDLRTQPVASLSGLAQALSATVRGTLHLGGTSIPVALAIPSDGGDWSLACTAASISLPSVGDLARLFSDSGALDSLPPELDGLGSLELSDLKATFNPVTSSVSSVTVGMATSQPLEIVPGTIRLDQVKALVYALNVTDPAGGRSVRGVFSGTLDLAGVPLALEADLPGLALTGRLAPETQLNLTTLLERFLPDGVRLPPGVPDVVIADLLVTADAREKTFAFYARSHLDWEILPQLLTVGSVEVDVNLAPGASQASVAGTLRIGGVDVFLSAEIGPTMQLTGAVDQISLAALVADVFAGASLPDEVPDVSLDGVTVSLNPSTGEFSLTGSASSSWHFGAGGPSVATRVDASLTRGARPAGQYACSVKLTATGPLPIVDGLALSGIQLAFQRSADGPWTASGDVKAQLLDSSVDLRAAYATRQGSTTFTLSTSLEPARDLVMLAGVGGLTAGSLSLELDRLAATDGTSGQRKTAWKLAATGGLHMDQVFDLQGTLALVVNADGSAGLSFTPTTAQVVVPLAAFSEPSGNRHAALHLDFGAITVGREAKQAGDKGSGWSFSSALQLSVTDLPPRVTRIIPLPDAVHATFTADAHSATVTADRLLAPIDVQLPDLPISSSVVVPLGKARLDVTNLSVALGGQIAVSADIGVGLPSELNSLFGRKSDGTPAVDIFNTFDPANPETTTIVVELSASEQTVSLKPRSSPFKAVHLAQVDGAAWWDCDLGPYGAVRIQVPELRSNPADGTFAASGAFAIDQDRPLQLPLAPVKHLLGKAGAGLPDGLPLREINLLNANGTLNVDAVLGLLPTTAAADEFKRLIEQLAGVVDQLPDTLKEYLNISVPQSLSFSLAVSPEGSLKFDIVADPQQPLKLLYPTLALLPPWPTPMPVLFGLKLKSLSFGPLAGGSLFLLQVDAILDQFDIVGLATALLLPQDGSVPLPAARALQRRLILEKLFAIIFYETVVPVVIPVFFDQLGVEYLGLEGVAAQAHARFPMPSPSLRDAARLFSELKQFFTDNQYFLPTDPAQAPKDLNLVFSLSRDYLKLPKYLSTKTLGIPGDGPSLSLYQTIATVLNNLKRLSVGGLTFDDVLQLIPIEYRVGHDELTFGPLTMSTDWLITTPDEFLAGAYRRLGAYASQPAAPAADFDAVIPLPPTADAGSGGRSQALVSFLRGSAGIDGVASFDAIFGLAASSAQGFQTGLRLTGSIAGLLQAELGGHVSLRLPDPRTARPVAPLVAGTSRPGSTTYALSFDGQSAYVDVPSLNLHPSAFTVEWWLNPRSHRNWNQSIAATRGWGAFQFHTTDDGAVYVGTDNPTRLTPNEIPNGTIQLNQWQHLAFTFDNGTGSFYKNGRLLAAKSGMAAPVAWGGFRLGLPNAGTVDGQVADVRVWSTARKAADIQAGMYRRLAGDEPGLLGCWLCDDGQGGVANDATGNNPGTLNGATWVQPGLVRLSGLVFDGRAAYVDVPDLALRPQAFTVEWWLNPRSHHDWTQHLLAKPGWGAFTFHTTETGGVYVGTDAQTRLTPAEIHDGTIELNRWQHLAFTYDNGTGSFYKDGRLLATRTGMALPVAWTGFSLGRPDPFTIDGTLDEVRIWTRALPAAELQATMLNRLSGTEPGLEACWRFDQPTGATLDDLTGRHVASLVGAARAEQPVIRLSGLAFDGRSSYADVPALTLQPTAFTVEWWLNPRSHHDWNQHVMAKPGWGAFTFHTTETGAAYVGTDTLTRLTPNEIPDNTIELNQWQHLAFTFDNGTGTFYKNGRLVATRTGMSTPQPWTGFSLGRPDALTLDGLIDEVRIWNRALPAQEIQANLRRQRGGGEPDLYAYWRFDQVPTDTVADRTVHAWPTILNGARGLATQIPSSVSQSAFQLDGYSHLSLLNHRLFDGDIQVTNDRFWLSGNLDLFPPDWPLRVQGQIRGWIAPKEFYLAGDVAASLAGLNLAEAHALLRNDRILLSGTCLGVASTLDVRQQGQDLLVSGLIRPRLTLSVDLGPIRDATHVLAQNVHLDLDVGATLDVAISRSGFSARVVASALYAGQSVSVGPFTLSVAPADLQALGTELRKEFASAGLQLFRSLFADANAWLHGITSGVVEWATGAYADMGRVLKEVYGRNIDEATQLLRGAGRQAEEIGHVLYSTYTTSVDEASKALSKARYTADEVGATLKNVFQVQTYAQIQSLRAAGGGAVVVAQQIEQQARLAATTALNGAGYDVNQIVGTLKRQYGASPDAAASVLKQANYSLKVVGDAVSAGWAASPTEISRSLRTAGYTVDQVGGYLKVTFNYAPEGLGQVLHDSGFPVSDVKSFFEELGGGFTEIGNKLDPTKW